MKILIAEDDPAQQRLLSHLAERWGYDTRLVATGAAAIEAFSDRDVVIALIDWDLPDMTGLEVCQQLADLGRFVHAIMLTARNADADIPVALDAGASDYLGKPFAQAELRARLLVGQRMVQLQRQITQMQKLESIGQLAAGVAHEINSPAQFVSDNLSFACDATADLTEVFAAYRGLAEAAQALPACEAALEKVQAVAEEKEADYLLQELPACLVQSLDGITRVAEIVRAMKSFSHPGGGERSFVDIPEALQSTATVARHEWRHVAELELDLTASLPPVWGHPGELNQVFLNLLVNAAHAVAEAHGRNPEIGRIRMSATPLPDGVEICVEDNGSGIPDAIVERVFDPFFTTKGVGKGTGQGLAIAYDVVVRKHGGRIWIESDVGVGTTFHLTLPAGTEEADADATA